MLLTFFLAVIGWIIFRAESIGQAWEYVCGICDASLFSIPYLKPQNYFTPLFVIILIIIEWCQRNKEHALTLYGVRNSWLRKAFYAALIITIVLFNTGFGSQFIYFQF